MESRDNIPTKLLDNDEDSKKKNNFDKYPRGYGRRPNYYARNEFRRNGSFNHFQNKYTINDRSFDRKFNHNNTKEDNLLTWRKERNTESKINQRESLVTQMHQCQYECMICFINIDLEVNIWSCESCYHLFHIKCIKKWSKTCGNDNDNKGWRCPACQKEYSIFCEDLLYLCFCGKMKNPAYNRDHIPHSCGNICGKTNKNNPRCPHVCSILCHPGPCPACEASINTNCYCGNIEFTVKCSANGNYLSCGSQCKKLLNCSVHICQEICHENDCHPCKDIVSQKCCCGQEVREVLCGSLESYESFFTCNNICNRSRNCGFHTCGKKCHPGPCESCQRLPENMKYCACGQTSLKVILGVDYLLANRKSCTDPIPTCEKICNKPFGYCDHKCLSICHEDECLPCDSTSNVKCRCNRTSRNMRCAEVLRILSMGEDIKCTIRCKSKKMCGIHRCQDLCCDIKSHICTLTCGKLLSCKKHSCQRPCHRGDCPKCDNVSFDELFCECGATNMLPPIACGQSLPICSFLCSRVHICDHEMVHNCHNEPQCPPCTVLTSKECPGGHKILYNIPCFRPVVTCGLICNKPLQSCSHLCNKICHDGNCTDESFVCTQLCSKLRTYCAHPCNLQCHTDDCALNMKSCVSVIELRCACGIRSLNVICDKVEKVNTMIKSNGTTNKKDASDFCLSDKGDSILLLCNNDCKKANRSKQLSEAFESEGFTFEHVAFSSFLREFSIKNPDFLIQIDSTLCNLIKKLEMEKVKKTIHRFTPMNREKRRFIQELSEHFALSVTNSDIHIISIEAVKGLCKIPNHRLIHFIQKNYPALFKNDKPTSLKNLKVQSTDTPYTERSRVLNVKKS